MGALKSVQHIPGHTQVGSAISTLMDSYFDANPKLESLLFQSIGQDDIDHNTLEFNCDELRALVAAELTTGSSAIDVGPIDTGEYSSAIRGHLLMAWLQKAGDPGVCIAEWLWTGAPAGIRDDYQCLDGLFPRVRADAPEFGPQDLHSDFETFVNYKGIEADEAVADILSNFLRKGICAPLKRCRQ